jgi:hypothetical protein
MIEHFSKSNNLFQLNLCLSAAVHIHSCYFILRQTLIIGKHWLRTDRECWKRPAERHLETAVEPYCR